MMRFWTKDHIESLFLTCFVSLVILSLLEKRTNGDIPIGQLIESMKSFSCINEFSNVYMFTNKDENIDKLSDAFNIRFTKKRLPREKIKKILKY